MRYRTIINLNAFLLCFLFAIVFTAQTLGFLGIYWRWIAVPLVVVITGAALTGYYRFSYGWFDTFEQDDFSDQSLLTVLTVSIITVFVVAVFGARMVLWPYSELGQFVPSDFHGYHALKALALVRLHNYWDVTVPYGQYPLGYESFLAFSQALTGSLQWTGVVQFVFLLWLITTLMLLLRRYARLPLSLSLIISTGLLFIPPLYGQLLSIGKNDVLLSITVLSAILHGSAAPDKRFHPLGLAYATLISIATKTGGLFVLVYLWVLILWGWWQAYQKGEHLAYLHPAIFGAAIGLMFPGGLWVVRNVIRMGAVLSPELTSFGGTTIISNLTNTTLYTSGNESITLVIAAGYMVTLVAFLWLNKGYGWRVALLLVMITLSFITTPLSAFHTPQSTVLHVEWRYVLHGALFGYVAFVALIAALVLNIWEQLTDSVAHQAMVILLMVFGLGGIVWVFDVPDSVRLYEANYRAALVDEYPAIADAEYDSIYDYAAQEIDGGVLYIEAVEPFFFAYPNSDAYVTYGTLYPLGLSGRFDVPTPDYAITSADHDLSFDHLPDGESFNWELIYEDRTGRIYQRLP